MIYAFHRGYRHVRVGMLYILFHTFDADISLLVCGVISANIPNTIYLLALSCAVRHNNSPITLLRSPKERYQHRMYEIVCTASPLVRVYTFCEMDTSSH